MTASDEAGPGGGSAHERDSWSGGAGRGPDGRSTGIGSGRGVPSWLAATVRYCSRCGAELRFGPLDGEDRDRLACGACGFVAYVNPRLVVTTLPVTDERPWFRTRRLRSCACD